MGERRENVGYKQDNLGNERKDLDHLRAQEGMVEDGDTGGIVNLTDDDAGTVTRVFEKPEHATDLYLKKVEAYSEGGEGDTFSVFEVETDDAGNITDSVRRSVPQQIESGVSKVMDYDGQKFDGDVGVSADFAGYVGVAVFSDHEQSDEPALDQ